MAIHCMHILVRASRHFCESYKQDSLDYGQVMKFAIEKYASRSFRIYADVGQKIVNVFVIITEFGFCCTYFIFISSNLHQFLLNHGNQHISGKQIKHKLKILYFYLRIYGSTLLAIIYYNRSCGTDLYDLLNQKFR